MQVTKQKRIIVIGAVMTIIFGAMYFILYQPLIAKVKNASLYCRRVEGELKTAREAISSLKQNGIKRTLATEEEVSAAIEELTEKGNAKEINFISIAPQKAAPMPENPAYKILPVEMEISGSYENVGGFMGELDSFEKSIVTVNNFRLAADAKNSSKVEAKLILNMYLSGE